MASIGGAAVPLSGPWGYLTYYATWNLGANTLGQFGTFLWTALADGEVARFSQLPLLGLPAGFLSGLVFMRVVDRPARHAWFGVGSALIVLAWALPVLLGPSRFTLVAVMLLSGLGNSFAGGSIYKVWSQELFPTLLRAPAQGVTMAFTSCGWHCRPAAALDRSRGLDRRYGGDGHRVVALGELPVVQGHLMRSRSRQPDDHRGIQHGR